MYYNYDDESKKTFYRFEQKNLTRKKMDADRCSDLGNELISTCDDKQVTNILKQYLAESMEYNSQYVMLTKEGEEKAEKAKMVQKKISTLKQNFQSTTGYNFEGYNILGYKGIVSGEVVIGTGFMSEISASVSDLFGTQSKLFAGKMMEVKQVEMERLIQNALVQGGNALIGVDFDYITFGNNVLGISANGTSVIIQKIGEVQ